MIKDMLPKLQDAKDLWETLKNNLFINRPAKEIKMGRFNYREKLEYLALLWGTFVMGATGFILWYEVEWLKYFPKWSYDVARAVHFYEAILATLAIVVWHFYSVLLDPDVYPMDRSWLTGKASADHLRHTRPDYYRELVEGQSAQPAASPDAPGDSRGPRDS